MEENSQWQAFTQTGDIRHYLLYKEEQVQAMAHATPQKENADGHIRDVGVGFTRSEI